MLREMESLQGKKPIMFQTYQTRKEKFAWRVRLHRPRGYHEAEEGPMYFVGSLGRCSWRARSGVTLKSAH